MFNHFSPVIAELFFLLDLRFLFFADFAKMEMSWFSLIWIEKNHHIKKWFNYVNDYMFITPRTICIETLNIFIENGFSLNQHTSLGDLEGMSQRAAPLIRWTFFLEGVQNPKEHSNTKNTIGSPLFPQQEVWILQLITSSEQQKTHPVNLPSILPW